MLHVAGAGVPEGELLGGGGLGVGLGVKEGLAPEESEGVDVAVGDGGGTQDTSVAEPATPAVGVLAPPPT